MGNQMGKIPNWIDVADGLPENFQHVLIFFDDQTITTGYYIHRFTRMADNGWHLNWEYDEDDCDYIPSGWYEHIKSEVGLDYSHHSLNGEYEPSRVTHWMPLPQPPRGIE